MKCVICGKEFQSNRPYQKTCSIECREENQRRQNRKSKQQRCIKKGKPQVTIGTILKCPVCGEEFIKEYKNQVCCSPECQKLRNHDKRNADKLWRREQEKKQGKTPKAYECHNCGKQFTPNYAKEKFCSDKCRLQFFHLEEWLL